MRSNLRSNARLLSPVTGNLKEYQVIIDFGKYEGLTVSEVAAMDPEFYQRLASEKNTFAIKSHRDRSFRLYQTIS